MKYVFKSLLAICAFLLPVSASQAVPNRVTNGLVGEWHLSTINSLSYRLAPDTSGYGRHGRVYGSNPDSWGWTDNAVDLRGNKYIQVPNSSNLNFGTGSFTITAWIRITDIDNDGFPVKTIVSNHGSDARGYSLSLTWGQYLNLNLSDTPNYTYGYSSNSYPFALNRWYHVAVSVNRTSWPVGVAFYVDGQDAGYGATPLMGNVNNSDRPFYIGSPDYPAALTSFNFNDRLDEVYIFNRALPNWEIWTVMNPGKSLYHPSFWNDGGSRQYNNNCYNYANNRATNTFAQPGRAAGAQSSSMTCPAMIAAAIADGLQPVTYYPNWPLDFKGGLALVTGYVGPYPDYHWYRLDDDGTWSHKPGGTAATNRDNSGNIITDPRTANRGGYGNFCGFFLAWSDIADGYGHERIN